MATTCLKCDHERRFNDPPPLTECPQCGAVYAKLEALVASGASIRPAAQTMPPPLEAAGAMPAPLDAPSPPRPPKPPLPQASFAARTSGPDAFIVQMRRESNYHGFRDVVHWTFWLMTLVSLVLGITALVALFTGQVVTGITSAVGAIAIMAIARAARDGALMLADLSDAAVRMAERTSR